MGEKPPGGGWTLILEHKKYDKWTLNMGRTADSLGNLKIQDVVRSCN